MRRIVIGGFVMAGMVAGVLATGAEKAEASKPYTPVTKLACIKCHTKGAKGDTTDLNACGKKSLDVLKKGGYKTTADQGEQKEWAQKLLKGFSCD